MAQALLNVPKTARRGEVIEIRALVAHPMETGLRPGPDGKRLPRNIIRTFTARFRNEPFFTAELNPSVAANPYLSFFLRVEESGRLEVRWQGDEGFDQTEAVEIRVA